MKVTLIGDIHGHQDIHLQLIKSESSIWTIQLGDCGFNYKYMEKINPEFHKILGGNHDNYNLLQFMPHYLGNFGFIWGMGFVRGAMSIDKQDRLIGQSWWQEEELGYQEANRALEWYGINKPSIMISHDCPDRVKKAMYNKPAIPSLTGKLLDEMFLIHQPRFWFFAHHHKNVSLEVMGTTFRCVNMYDTVIVDT